MLTTFVGAYLTKKREASIRSRRALFLTSRTGELKGNWQVSAGRLRRGFAVFTVQLRTIRISLSAGIVAALLSLGAGSSAIAAEAQAAIMGPSGLPLPRFVSLKSNRINLRVGPGRDYAVQWLYVKPGLPVEIIQEYDNWRRIRDADGTEGWVLQTLLTGKRSAVAAPWGKDGRGSPIPLYSEAEETAVLNARLEPGVIGKIEACDGNWCRFEAKGHDGFVRQTDIWGAYPGEQFDD
jgi:SH3-like domain-containing protein